MDRTQRPAESFKDLYRLVTEPEALHTQYAGTLMTSNFYMRPAQWTEWGNRARTLGYTELELLDIPPTTANLPLLITWLPTALQPILLDGAPWPKWFIPSQGDRQLTAEAIAWIMTLPFPNEPRWQLYGIGVGAQADGVFLNGRLTSPEEMDIKRGIFPPSLSVWGRPAEGFRHLSRLNGASSIDQALTMPAPPHHEPSQTSNEGARQTIEDWLENCTTEPHQDHQGVPTSGGSTLPTYDQATAGLSSPDYQDAVGGMSSETRQNSVRRRVSLAKVPLYDGV